MSKLLSLGILIQFLTPGLYRSDVVTYSPAESVIILNMLADLSALKEADSRIVNNLFKHFVEKLDVHNVKAVAPLLKFLEMLRKSHNIFTEEELERYLEVGASAILNCPSSERTSSAHLYGKVITIFLQRFDTKYWKLMRTNLGESPLVTPIDDKGLEEITQLGLKMNPKLEKLICQYFKEIKPQKLYTLKVFLDEFVKIKLYNTQIYGAFLDLLDRSVGEFEFKEIGQFLIQYTVQAKLPFPKKIYEQLDALLEKSVANSKFWKDQSKFLQIVKAC